MEQEALRWSGPQPLEDLRVLQVHEKLADVLKAFINTTHV